jgi:TonB family protein
LFSVMDYPAEARRLGQEGLVRVALTIDEQGRVSGCTVEESSRSPALDSATCMILRRRARFEPARDLAGRAVASATRTNILWKLAPVMPIPVTEWSASILLEADAAGEVTSCRSERSATAPQQVLDCRSDEMRRAIRMIVLRKMVRDGAPYGFRGEARMTPGKAPLTASPAHGETVIHRAVAHLQVAADGVLARCDLLEQVGGGPRAPECRRLFAGPYAPAKDASGAAVLSDATVLWSLVQVGASGKIRNEGPGVVR